MEKKQQKTKILMLEVTPVLFENNKHVVSVWIVDCLNDLQSKLIIIIYHCHGYWYMSVRRIVLVNRELFSVMYSKKLDDKQSWSWF